MRSFLLLSCAVALFGCSASDKGAEGMQGPAGAAAGQAAGGAAGTSNSAGEGGDAAAGQAGAAMPSAGAGGEGAAPATAGGAGGAGGSTPVEPGPMGVPYAMDECEIDSGFVGDAYCILPPPPDQGFQLRIGPTDYANPEPIYVLEPGEEFTNNFPAVSGNEADIHFLFRQFRMRPGAHHMIVTAGGSTVGGGELFGGRRIATANLSQDSPVGGIIAPENEGVGIPLDARSSLSVSLHSINTSDMPQIREIWVNFWYRDSAKVTETAEQLFAVGDVSFAVQPGQDTILGPYSCDVQGEGRMLWFYGHRHASNRRFSAWRVRGAQRDLFYEGYEWEEVLLLEYTSLITNPLANRATHTEGGWSGVLDLRPGDRLEWECHVVNEQENVLRFTNNTYTGEMCIMDAEIVGTNCSSGFRLPGGF